jgi:hypothetical protein
VTDDGGILLIMDGGEIRQPQPVVYQASGASKRAVSARYVLDGAGALRVEVGDYDRSRPLTIDPLLVYSQFIGGSESDDYGRAVAVDTAGAIYVAGETDADDFPVSSSAFQTRNGSAFRYAASRDAFVAKISADGTSLLWATYLGGDLEETSTALAVDAAGSVYLTGSTLSSDFPTTPGAYDRTINDTLLVERSDAFAAKIAADGASLVYSTYLGGAVFDVGRSIAVDSGGAAVVAGLTRSQNFPTTPGAFDTTITGGNLDDVFVTKLSANGASLVFSTALGGTQYEKLGTIAIDATNAVYIAGSTASPNFPTTAGAFDQTMSGSDGFVAKLSANGAVLLRSTLIGGSGFEEARALALDATGAVYVAGYGDSTDFPATAGSYEYGSPSMEDMSFVTKLDAELGALAYSARIRTDPIRLRSLAVDAAGAVYALGYGSEQWSWPTTSGAFDTTPSRERGGAVMKLSPGGDTLVYSTYFGEAADAAALAVDGAGRAVVVCSTSATYFPSTPGSFSPRQKGGVDATVTRLNGDGTALDVGAFISGKRSLNHSTAETVEAVAVGGDGSVYLAGQANSPLFPNTPGVADDSLSFSEAFVTKLTPDAGSLVYSTFIGGRENETCIGMSVGPSGEVYVAGLTHSLDFPVTAGAVQPMLSADPFSLSHNPDAYVAKLTPSGDAFAYATYFGGLDDETVTGFAVAGDGLAVLVGYLGGDIPTTPGAFDTSNDLNGRNEGFVVKLDAVGGSYVYSSYLGRSEDDRALGVAVDAEGNAWVVGSTFSTDFPTTSDAFDDDVGPFDSQAEGFVTKVAADGSSILFSSFVGGRFGDRAVAVALSGDSTYVAGSTSSDDFATTEGAFDTVPPASATERPFVVKVGVNGALGYSTFFGPPGTAVEALAVGPENTLFLTGAVDSTSFPVTPGAYDTLLNGGAPNTSDAFLSELSSDGSALLYSTYLGGLVEDRGTAVAIGDLGYVYVGGMTHSGNFASTGFGIRDSASGFVARILPEPGSPRSKTSVGVYDPATGNWFVKYSNEPGPADAVFSFGAGGPTLVPISGDWDADGDDTPGVYDSATGTFFLKNELAAGPADLVFSFGPVGAGVRPLVGMWSFGAFRVGIGVYVEATGTFFLRDDLSPGPANYAFSFGPGGADTVPLVGRWTMFAQDTVGIYVKSTGTFFLRSANQPGPANFTFTFGPPNSVPLVGSWDQDTVDGVGVYVPSTGSWFLRNAISPGAADLTFGYGPPALTPVVGNWSGY